MRKLMLLGIFLVGFTLSACTPNEEVCVSFCINSEEYNVSGSIQFLEITKGEATLKVNIEDSDEIFENVEVIVYKSNYDIVYRVDDEDGLNKTGETNDLKIKYLDPNEEYTAVLYGYHLNQQNIYETVLMGKVEFHTDAFLKSEPSGNISVNTSVGGELSILLNFLPKDYYVRIVFVALYKNDEIVQYHEYSLYEGLDSTPISTEEFSVPIMFYDLEEGNYTLKIWYNYRNETGRQSTTTFIETDDISIS